MTKTLKFENDLAELILQGKKTTTWRLFDDKNLKEKDVVTLIRRPEMTPFAQAKLVEVIEKLMRELTEKDKTGHEKFKTDKQMYTTYSQYCQKKIESKTPVKIIKFELIKIINEA